MYQYIEQPAENSNCNPYGQGILRLQCALITTLDSNVSINWYHNGTTQLTDVELSSAENITLLMETFRSILTVNPEPATDSGDYHCQAVVDGNNLQPSDAFTLSGDPEDVFNFMINRDCEGDSETDLFFTPSTKCADVSPTESATTPTTPPPQPSQTTLPTTTAPSLPTTVGGVAATNSPGSTTEDDITTSNTQNNESTGVIPETLQVWIYVLVGVAAVFGIIIVILAIMCVGLCVRRSKTQDSHTLKRESECVFVLGP